MKNACKWCGEKKQIMDSVSTQDQIAHGLDTSISTVWVKPYNGKVENYGMCFDCWVESYRKSHPQNIVKSFTPKGI